MLDKLPLNMIKPGQSGKVIGCREDGTREDITHARFTSLFIQKTGGQWVEARLNDSEEWVFTNSTDPDA